MPPYHGRQIRSAGLRMFSRRYAESRPDRIAVRPANQRLSYLHAGNLDKLRVARRRYAPGASLIRRRSAVGGEGLRAAANQLLPSSLLIVLFRLLIPIDGLRFGLGNPHPLSGNMPSIPSLGWRQVKNGRLFLATTEVPPSSAWCSKQEIQAVAATIQRLFRRQQNRNQFDQ